MTRSDWCAHGRHDDCPRLGRTQYGKTVVCGCGCHDETKEG